MWRRDREKGEEMKGNGNDRKKWEITIWNKYLATALQMSFVVCAEDNKGDSRMQTSETPAVDSDSISHNQTSSAAETVDEPVTSSSCDVELTSVASNVHATTVRRTQRQQLACQHEVRVNYGGHGEGHCPSPKDPSPNNIIGSVSASNWPTGNHILPGMCEILHKLCRNKILKKSGDVLSPSQCPPYLRFCIRNYSKATFTEWEGSTSSHPSDHRLPQCCDPVPHPQYFPELRCMAINTL